MSQKLSTNAVRYAVVLILAGIWAREFHVPDFGSTLIHRVSEITSFQENAIKVVVFGLPLLLIVFGGILADKYGRRLTWAVYLFLYGGGLLLLHVFMPDSTTLGPTFLGAALIGGSLIFMSSPLAWLFDHEKKEGTKNAYGIFQLLFALFLLITMGILLNLDSSDTRILTVAFSVLIVVMGLWVMTFPENYGNRASSRETATSGINQFISSRVLQLIVLQSIFLGLFSVAKMVSFIGFPWEFQTPAIDLSKIIYAEDIIAALSGGVFLLFMKRVDYKKLIIYPMILMAVFSFLIPLAPTRLVFFILHTVISAFSVISMVGIIILANDAIAENRATTLSLLVFLMTIAGFLSNYLESLTSGKGMEMLSLVAGACALVSLALLFVAVRVHEPRTEVSG